MLECFTVDSKLLIGSILLQMTLEENTLIFLEYPSLLNIFPEFIFIVHVVVSIEVYGDYCFLEIRLWAWAEQDDIFQVFLPQLLLLLVLLLILLERMLQQLVLILLPLLFRRA
jgi:hypothetical protein